MKKDYSSIIAVVFLTVTLGLIFFTMMPQWTSDDDRPLTELSTKRALTQVAEISKQPHYVGSKNHEVVANYLQKELNE